MIGPQGKLEPWCARGEWESAAGDLRECMGVPLFRGRERVGALDLRARKGQRWSPEQLALVRTASGALGAALGSRLELDRLRRAPGRDPVTGTSGCAFVPPAAARGVRPFAAHRPAARRGHDRSRPVRGREREVRPQTGDAVLAECALVLKRWRCATATSSRAGRRRVRRHPAGLRPRAGAPSRRTPASRRGGAPFRPRREPVVLGRRRRQPARRTRSHGTAVGGRAGARRRKKSAVTAPRRPVRRTRTEEHEAPMTDPSPMDEHAGAFAPDAPPARVLVVGDDETVAEVLREVLQELPYDLRFATSAEEAMRSVAEAQPDLILTDISLPGRPVSRSCAGGARDRSRSRGHPRDGIRLGADRDRRAPPGRGRLRHEAVRRHRRSPGDGREAPAQPPAQGREPRARRAPAAPRAGTAREVGWPPAR